MIFVTVGSEKFPFNRLIKEINKLKINEEIFMQIGSCKFIPFGYHPWKRFISFEAMIKNIKKARIIITHAGVGTILLCKKNNKIPIVIPRRKKFKEHVDDHQLELTKKLNELNHIIPLYNIKNLRYCIKNYNKLILKKKIIKNKNNKIIDYLKKELNV